MPKLIRITTVPISLKLLITDQMKYMASKGFVVQAVSADGPEIGEVMSREGVPHTVIPMTRQITPLQDMVALLKMISYLRRHKPDIVHTHTPKAGLIGMLAAKWCRVPVKIHTVAGMPLMTTSGMKRRILTWIEKLTYACADKVWANSQSLRRFIKQHKLVKPEKVTVIGKGSSNGIDLNRFDRQSLDPALIKQTKNAIHYDESKTYLLTVGRMVRDKGIPELVDAFLELKKTNSALKLVLLGPFEEDRDALSEGTKTKIQLSKDIIHIPWSDHVEYFMAQAHILVHPSHREGFPNVLLQAGALACPIVCSDIPGNNDIVQNKQTGLLFEVGQKGQIVEKLSWALDKYDQMKACASALKEEISQYYRRESLHQEIYLQYTDLLRGNHI